MRFLSIVLSSLMFLQTASAAFSCRRTFSLPNTKYMLTAVDAADLPAITEILADPRSMEMSGDRHTPRTIKRMIENSETLNRFVRGASMYILAYRDLRTNHVVGFVSTYGFNGRGKAFFGYAIHPAYWNQGFATEMTKAFLQFAREELYLNQLEASALQSNITSNQILAKLGFQKTGQKLISFGEPDNTYILSLKSED